jgi:hypothetical protein
MARGRRNDRTGSPGSAPKATSPGVPENYETVEFEELPDSTVSAEVPEPAAELGASGDTERTDAMAEPVDPREPEVEAAAPSEAVFTPPPPPPRRGGGFWAGLLGGLLGGAAVAGGGGWYLYEHGPLKPALARLDTTEAASREAANGLAALGGKLDQQGAALGGKLDQQGTDLTGVKSALQQADASIAKLGDRLAATDRATGELGTKVQQADSTFRAASEQVIGRLEAVNAKLVEVEQHQPADVVDKKTVADIAAKQASIEQGQKEVAAALARAEQMVTQGLEAGNKQAAALQTMVDAARTRMEEISAQQRDLLAMKSELDNQAKTNQEQAAALSAAAAQVQTVRAELQEKVQGARSELQQQLAETSSRLTTEGAARERSVGLSVATNSLDASLQTGQPFVPTVETLRQLGQDDQVVQGVADTLEPMATSGIPTAASLAQKAGEIERSLAPASKAESSDWLDRTRENLNNLVNLHPVDQEAVPGQNAVRDAKQALMLQDLPGAVAAMKPLADQGNEAAKAWVAAAQQRLAATDAVETLRQHLKTTLARQG